MHRHRQLMPNSSSFPTSSIPVQANKPAFWFHFFWQHICIAFSIGKSSDQTSVITWHCNQCLEMLTLPRKLQLLSSIRMLPLATL